MRFTVDIMLTGFGIFWGADGASAHWLGSDVAIVVLISGTLLVSVVGSGSVLRRGPAGRSAVTSCSAGYAGSPSPGTTSSSARPDRCHRRSGCLGVNRPARARQRHRMVAGAGRDLNPARRLVVGRDEPPHRHIFPVWACPGVTHDVAHHRRHQGPLAGCSPPHPTMWGVARPHPRRGTTTTTNPVLVVTRLGEFRDDGFREGDRLRIPGGPVWITAVNVDDPLTGLGAELGPGTGRVVAHTGNRDQRFAAGV